MAQQWRNILRFTPSGVICINGPVLADDPDDGGKWVLYCDHLENGEWLNAALIQDNNRARLAGFRHETRGYGYTEWCELCQNQHEQHHTMMLARQKAAGL